MTATMTVTWQWWEAVTVGTLPLVASVVLQRVGERRRHARGWWNR